MELLAVSSLENMLAVVGMSATAEVVLWVHLNVDLGWYDLASGGVIGNCTIETVNGVLQVNACNQTARFSGGNGRVCTGVPVTPNECFVEQYSGTAVPVLDITFTLFQQAASERHT